VWRGVERNGGVKSNKKANVIDESSSGAIKSNENRPTRPNDDVNGDQY
jgi:hypothetical protein